MGNLPPPRRALQTLGFVAVLAPAFATHAKACKACGVVGCRFWLGSGGMRPCDPLHAPLRAPETQHSHAFPLLQSLLELQGGCQGILKRFHRRLHIEEASILDLVIGLAVNLDRPRFWCLWCLDSRATRPTQLRLEQPCQRFQQCTPLDSPQTSS